MFDRMTFVSYNILAALSVIWLFTTGQWDASQPEIELNYPLQHMVPVMGKSFSSEVNPDQLKCFGNHDYVEPAYRQTLMCMVPLPSSLSRYVECDSVWGSRGVVVTVKGSVEFLQLSRLPPEGPEEVSLKAHRWLALQSISGQTTQREVKNIPAGPFYLCARSIDWAGNTSSFHLDFRPVFLRAKDRTLCSQKLLLHVVLMLAVSSLWLLPYIAAFVTCVVTYSFGMHRFGVALGVSSFVVCFAPLMLSQRHRDQARVFIGYFFGPRKAQATRAAVRRQLPLFQALFFSCALVCIGSAGSYIMYAYLGVDREMRNLLIKLTLGISSGWFIFVLCRSFDAFFNQWSWLVLTTFLLKFLAPHMNPECKQEVACAVLLITAVTNKFVVSQIDVSQNLRKISQLLGMEHIIHDREVEESEGKNSSGSDTHRLHITVNVSVDVGADRESVVRDVQTAVEDAVTASLAENRLDDSQ